MQLGRRISTAVLGAMLWAIPIGAAAQTGNVAGRVVDEVTREALVGAQVAIGETGGLTDDGGRFMIQNVPAGVHTLRVLQLGYAEATRTITVTAGQTTVLELALGQQAIELGELVVVGYGTESTNELTGSIEQVGTEEFNTGRVISPEQLIQGKVAGVNIVDSGEPGGGIAVRVRGGTSINASNDPLYVIDGQPIAVGGGISAGRNPLNFLNPADIENITVLKDASATAIYGSRGANGVVIIETRGGSGAGMQGSHLSYSGSISSSTVAGSPDMLDADEFRMAVEGWGGSADDFLLDSETDWFDEIQRDGIGHDHNIAFEGGRDDLSYRFSVGYLNQEGVIRGSATERATVGINYGQNFFEDLLRVTANIKGAQTEDEFTPGGVIGGAAIYNPTAPVRTNADTLGGFFEFTESDLGPVNPIAELEMVIDEGTTYRSIGDVEATLAMPFLRSLTGTVRLGYDVTKTNRQVFRPSALFGETREDTLAGYTSHANNTATNVLLEAFANYGTRLGVADLDFTGGYTFEESEAEFPFFEARGLEFDYLETSGIPSALFERTAMFVEGSRLISFFGRTNINLFDRYLVTLSLRRDGSSRFGPDEQWGTFPSVAVAWRLSDETFMENVPLFNSLKVRASWGVNGNQAIANNLQFSSYTLGESTAQYQFGDVFVPTIRPSAADPGIKWEETTSWNLGLDWSILSDRISGAVDYYFKETDDLIFNVPVAAGTNLSNFVTTNIGTMENQGIEFSLDARLFGGDNPGDFYWIAGLVASHNENQLVRVNPRASGETILTGGIAGGVGNFIQVLRPGESINSFFVYRHRRDENGLPLYEDTDGDGDIEDIEMYVDQDENGIINQDDRVPFHDPEPDWILGHTSRMGWKAFDASFTLRAHLGNYVYNNVASNYGHFRALRYVDVPNNLHASVLETGFEEEQYFSDYYVEDASFLRMENLTIGYTLDPFSSGQQVRLFGTVQNVFTMTEYRGVDPLAGLRGIDNNLYPRSRTFIAGANVSF